MWSRFIISTFTLLSVSLAVPAFADDDRGYIPGYGTYSGRSERDTIRCESRDFSLQRCPMRTQGEVFLSRQLSSTPCQQGQNWGYDRRGIWVDNGCAAEFAVEGRAARREYNDDRWYRGNDSRSRYGNDYGYGQSYAARGAIRCESEGFEFTRCRVRTGGEVRLVRQLSQTPCRRGENWGFDRRGIWVDKGCAAEFSVAGGDQYYSDRR